METVARMRGCEDARRAIGRGAVVKKGLESAEHRNNKPTLK
jgi:hypothetical protein